jgi:hypothetical protein
MWAKAKAAGQARTRANPREAAVTKTLLRAVDTIHWKHFSPLFLFLILGRYDFSV